MKIESSTQGSVTVLRLSGEINETDVKAFRENLSTHKAGACFVLDLSGVLRLSSYALALIGFHQAELAQSGGRLALAAVPPNGMRAIELAGLQTHIEIHASLDEAVSALSA